VSERFRHSLFFRPAHTEETDWPAIDIYETRDGWLLKCDLAGIRPEDVRVHIQGCRITIQGSRRDLLIEEISRRHRMEIAYNEFQRTVELPCDLPDPQVELTLQDGFLFVRVRATRAPEETRP
jgi:HSP20 family protein